MGFFSSIIEATVQVALTPIAVVKDVVDVSLGNEADNTKELLDSAKDNVINGLDDLVDGNI